MSLQGNIVVTGAGGMLARAVVAALQARGVPFETRTRSQLDLADLAAIDALDLSGVRAVINCAAWTDVDGAETREAEATVVNGDAVGRLAHRCRDVGATLVHFSTDYVFNGRAQRPYPVDGPLEPLNAYGRSKARGEVLVAESGADHLIARTSWLYAPWGKNFVRTMVAAGKQRPELKVVDDQRGRPTSAEHLAETTLALLERGVRGTVHVSDGGECTWYDFAKEILARTAPECRVQPCTSEAFPRPAKRPEYSVLALEETERHVGPMPDWRNNLASVLDRLE